MDSPQAITPVTGPSAATVDGFALVIEASSGFGSVALYAGDSLLHHRAAAMGVSRDDSLFPALQAVLEAANIAPAALSAIVCGGGPGSFTSLRIAASLAKGLAHATGVSLFAVSSLLLAAAAHDQSGEFVVHADALRGERYAMLVRIDRSRMVHADSAVSRVTLGALDAMAGDRHRLSVLGTADSAIETSVTPDAAHLHRVHGWRDHARVSLDQWEPAYGRLAEAQVKWELTHRQSLPANG